MLHENLYKQIYKEHKFDCVSMRYDCVCFISKFMLYIMCIEYAVSPVTMGRHQKPLPGAEQHV